MNSPREIPEYKPQSTASGKLTITREEVEAKFKDVNFTLFAVILILIIMVAALIIDSLHINSATYKEYSEKLQTLDSLQESNRDLSEQNKHYQELILQQQKQILELLRSKK